MKKDSRFSGKISEMLTSREKYITIVDNDMIASADAIILLEGDGTNRVNMAARLYSDGFAKKIVFSGGAVNYDYGSFPKDEVIPILIASGVKEGDIIIDEKSMHTKAQADEVVQLAIANGWKRLILVASPDHQYRAYLTFLKTILDKVPELILINAPARNLRWFENKGWKTQFDRLDQEFDRIDKYFSMGHLATFEQAIEYQKWKEQQLRKPN